MRDPERLRSDLDAVFDTPETDATRARVGSFLFDTPPPQARLFRHYRLERRIGSGGMGKVYSAFDTTLHRKVAIKFLHTAPASASARARMLQEARALARVDHRNVVRVIATGQADDQTWLVMQYVRGSTLRRWLADNQDQDKRFSLLLDIAEGLIAVHQAGIVHRDLKPENVLVGDDGVPRIADFGVASLVGAPSTAESSASSSSTTRTSSGLLVGTPAYMAPEQLRGERADAKADQFAFCIVAWEALLGCRPFSGTTAESLLVSIQRSDRHRVARRRVRRHIIRTLEKGLALRPAQRFGDMAELVARLKGRRRGWMTGAGLATIALGLASSAALDGGGLSCSELVEADRPWTSDEHRALRDAFRATELVHADATAERVAETLRGYADRWVEQRHALCGLEAASDADVQLALAPRYQCLERRRDALLAMLAGFKDASPLTVDRAVAAAESLPPVRDCRDPQNPYDGLAAEPVSVELESARASRRLGRATEAQALATSAWERAEQQSSWRHMVRALLIRATARRDLGHLDEASQDLQEAVTIGTEYRLDFEVLEAKIMQTELSASTVRSRYEAERQLRDAQDWANRVRDPAQDARLELVAARVLALTDAAAALEAVARIIELRATMSPETADEVAGLLSSLMYQVGRFEDAAKSYRQLIGARTQRLGPLHPRTADAHYGLGLCLDRQGLVADASAEYHLALQSWSGLGARHTVDTANAQIALANLDLRRGDNAAVVRRVESVMSTLSELVEPASSHMAQALTLQGAVRHAQGRFPDAARAHQAALDIYEIHRGHESAYAAIARSNLGEALLFAGSAATAREHLLEAGAILVEVTDSDHPYRAFPEKGLGILALLEGRQEEARRRLTEAHRLIGDVDATESLEIDAALALASASPSAAVEVAPEIQTRAAVIGPYAERRVAALVRLVRSQRAAE